MKILIDVSEHNGKVNLQAAKNTISGIIARCSWGWGNSQIDKQWLNNAHQAEKLDIPLYAYHFCYARTPVEAEKEAQLALKACCNLPVNVIYYDIEYNEFQGDLTPKQYYEIANSFCTTIENMGYSVGVYANEYYFRTKLIHEGFSKWTLWIANYGLNDGYDNWNGKLKYNPFGNVLIHQFTSKGKEGILKNIKGIASEGLDCNNDYGLLKQFNKYHKNDFISITLKNKVKVRKNATWYNGDSIPDFVYDNIYEVIEVLGDRIVIGLNGDVTGAINENELILVD